MPAHGAEWVVLDGEVLRPGRVGLSRSVAATRTARIGAELPVVEALPSGKWPTSDPRRWDQKAGAGWSEDVCQLEGIAVRSAILR
jgi:hypothetical protein